MPAKKKAGKKVLPNQDNEQLNTTNTHPQKRKIIIFRLISVIFSIILSLYLAEVILHELYIIPNPISHYYPLSVAKTGAVIQTNQYEYQTTHVYNSQGFRDHEIDFNLDDKKKRVLFLGDSFLEGLGVEQHDRFSDLLVNKLGKDYIGINAGQLATNPDNYFDNLITFGVALKPSLVIAAIFIGNDFQGGRSYNIPKTYVVNEQIDKKYLQKRSALIETLKLTYLRGLISQSQTKQTILYKRGVKGNFWDLYFGKKITKDFYIKATQVDEPKFDQITATFNQKLLPYYYNGQIIPTLLLEGVNDKVKKPETDPFYIESDYVNTLFFIKEMNTVLKTRNISYLVLIIPDINEVHPEKFQQVLKEDFKITNPPARLKQLEEMRLRLVADLAKENIQYVDVTSALKSSNQMTYHIYDQHMNSAGHAIVAAELLKALR